MKKLFVSLMLLTSTVGLSAQEKQHEKFSPEKFEAELQDFIVKEASLTPQETADFFPVYKEMQQKMRGLFDRQRQLKKGNPEDDKACRDAIRELDEIDLDMKKVQQTYHNRFLEILPASKVYNIMKAEDRFHRRMLKNSGPRGDMQGRGPGHKQGPMHGPKHGPKKPFKE